MSKTARIIQIWNKEDPSDKKLIGTKNASLKDVLYNARITNNWTQSEHKILKKWQVSSKREIDVELLKMEETIAEESKPEEPEMREIIPDEFLQLLKDNCVHNTFLTYAYLLRKFMWHYSTEWNWNVFHDRTKIKDFVDTLSQPTREPFTSAILKAHHLFSEHQINEVDRIRRYVSQKRTVEKIRRLQDPREAKITVERIRQIASQYKGHDLKAIIAWLYVDDAKRPDTWARVKIGKNVRDDDQFNYIDLETGILYLNRYKNYQTYGKKELKISNVPLEKIRKYHSEHNNEFLLDGMTANNLTSKVLKKVFGVSANALRHAHITHGLKTYGRNSKEMEDLLWRMNTSLTEAVLTYDDDKTIIKD